MSTQASIDKAIYQITEWALPRSRIAAAIGDTDYELYMQIESDRLKEKWTESWVQTNPAGEVALFTWAGDQLPVEGDDPKE